MLAQAPSPPKRQWQDQKQSSREWQNGHWRLWPGSRKEARMNSLESWQGGRSDISPPILRSFTAVLEGWHRIPISYYPTNTTKCEDEFLVILKAQVLKTQFMHQQWSCQGEAQWGAQGAEGVPGEQHSWLLEPLVAGLLPAYKEWLLWWPLQRNVAPESAVACLGSACPSASTQSSVDGRTGLCREPSSQHSH